MSRYSKNLSWDSLWQTSWSGFGTVVFVLWVTGRSVVEKRVVSVSILGFPFTAQLSTGQFFAFLLFAQTLRFREGKLLPSDMVSLGLARTWQIVQAGRKVGRGVNLARWWGPMEDSLAVSWGAFLLLYRQCPATESVWAGLRHDESWMSEPLVWSQGTESTGTKWEAARKVVPGIVRHSMR